MQKQIKKTKTEVLFTLVSTALLIALQVVLSRFLSVSMWNLKISFSFIPVVIAARLFGPVYSVAVYAIADIIGAILFPVGAYFPGYTLSAAISGLIFGLLLYKKATMPKIVIASVLNQLLCSFLLNSFWISITMGRPFTTLLATRWPVSLAMCAVMIIFMAVALEKLCALLEKTMHNKFSAKKAI